MRRKGSVTRSIVVILQQAFRPRFASALLAAFGAEAAIGVSVARAVECDGTEVVCLDLSSQAAVEATGGIVVGGTFEDGGFRPSSMGGIDWDFGPETDFASGHVSFDVKGLLPTTGTDVDGGKYGIFAGLGFDGPVGQFVALQKMDEFLLEGHLLRWGMSDDFADDYDSLIVSSGVFPCGLFTLAGWQADEVHHFDLTWAPDGVGMTVDDWSCGVGGNGDTFNPPTKTLTLGNLVEHPPNAQADGVFLNVRIWADGPGEQPPEAVIERITPTPIRHAAGLVSLMGSARDLDEGGSEIVAYEWRSSRNGLLGTERNVLIRASDLKLGAHTITFRAQDDEGDWAEDQLTVNVAAGTPGVYTIELPASDDATVRRDSPNANFGGTSDLAVGADNARNYDEASYLKFDAGAVPGTVLAATLHLECFNSGGSQQVLETGTELYTGGTWTEDNITWSIAPPPVGGPIDAVLGVSAGQRYAFDLTDAVTARRPLSVVFASSAPDGGGYRSKEHGEAFTQPVLELRYDAPDLNVFANGFESGNADAWSVRVP